MASGVRAWCAVAIAAALLAACSSSDGGGESNAEFCTVLERLFEVGAESTSFDDPAYVAAAADAVEVDAPSAIADDVALVISLEDGTDNGVIVDEAQYEKYQAALERFSVYMIDECGVDETLVR